MKSPIAAGAAPYCPESCLPFAHQAGQEGPAATSVRPLLDFYFSTLFRQTPGGVPVVDSYAWARINADGDVVMESVYWPAIPAAVVLEAEALSGTIGAPSSRAAFLAKLPQDADGEFGKGHVAIHHTSGAWPKGLAAHAVYDVRAGSRTIHYDSSGVARQLAEELPNAWGPVPSPAALAPAAWHNLIRVEPSRTAAGSALAELPLTSLAQHVFKLRQSSNSIPLKELT